MPLTQIHSFLVHPSKNEEKPPVVYGARLPLQGKLFQMLTALYSHAEQECDIEIIFRPSNEGKQDNKCRNLILKYLKKQSLNNGRVLATRLQSITTHRSGLGLLFIILGKEKDGQRLLLSRFPADQGVIAQERHRTLDVEFIERVFMKSARAYKSALYSGISMEADFWEGKAVDKQINEIRELSDYWIADFLDSELRTTAAAGTKRLAIALRETIRSTKDLEIRKELLSVVNLLPAQDGRRISPRQFLQTAGLTNITLGALRHAFPRPELFEETFQFDNSEFELHVLYRYVELDNGAFLMGVNSNFDKIFSKESQSSKGKVRYSTEGNVINEKLRKSL